MIYRILPAALLLVFLGSANAASVTGDPLADGWIFAGHSLENGVYVKGSANYGFNTYSAGLTVESGSNLEISDGSTSWLVGDNVVAVGGAFQSITAAAAGWGTFTGGAVNDLLPAGENPSELKLQVKFGTNLASWSASTVAPGSGNGNSSSGNGGGRVQVKTSGYFGATALTSGQTEPWTWAGNSGQLLVLDKDSHLNWDGASTQPSKYAARMIWNYDAGSGHVSSWELLLNTSLLGRLDTESLLLPAVGDDAIVTVQHGDSEFTDALVRVNAVIPVPAAAWFFGSAVGLLGWLRRRAT